MDFGDDCLQSFFAVILVPKELSVAVSCEPSIVVPPDAGWAKNQLSEAAIANRFRFTENHRFRKWAIDGHPAAEKGGKIFLNRTLEEAVFDQLNVWLEKLPEQMCIKLAYIQLALEKPDSIGVGRIYKDC